MLRKVILLWSYLMILGAVFLGYLILIRGARGLPLYVCIPILLLTSGGNSLLMWGEEEGGRRGEKIQQWTLFMASGVGYLVTGMIALGAGYLYASHPRSAVPGQGLFMFGILMTVYAALMLVWAGGSLMKLGDEY